MLTQYIAPTVEPPTEAGPPTAAAPVAGSFTQPIICDKRMSDIPVVNLWSYLMTKQYPILY
jgi:hypothetical protein